MHILGPGGYKWARNGEWREEILTEKTRAETNSGQCRHSLCVLHPTMAKRSFPIYGGLAGLQRSLFDTMDLQVGHVLKYTNLEDSMLLSCSRAADTSNPTFPGVKWVSSRKYMQIVVKKKTFFFLNMRTDFPLLHQNMLFL